MLTSKSPLCRFALKAVLLPLFKIPTNMERRVRKGKGRKSAYVNQPTAWHASQSCKEIAAQALSQTALGGRLFVGSIAQWEVILLYGPYFLHRKANLGS